ncbi:hypothetical protein ABPG74_019876 [Tetrahymena malaccensis]
MNSDNDIGCKGVQGLSSGIIKCTNIQKLTLFLMKDGIQSKGASELGFGLRRLINLSNLTLNLNENSIQDSGFEDLFLGLQGLSNLKSLEIQLRQHLTNSLSNKSAQKIAHALVKSVSIQTIVLQLLMDQMNKQARSLFKKKLFKAQRLVKIWI